MLNLFPPQGLPCIHCQACAFWSVVGSSNFDRRSVLFNDEVDAVVLGAATAQELQTMFDNDTKRAKQIDLASWRRRSILERINELYSTIWQDWL